MRLNFIGISAYLFLSIFLVCAEDGKYSVSIAFSQNVPSEKGKDIIDQLKESLQNASKILHNAIGTQFSKVMVEVPESWDTSEWNETVEDSLNSYSDTKADILIDNTADTVFGKLLFAQQYGGCGISGHQIILPTVFFHELNTFPKDLSIAREWLKYRYGVFDENGYLGDPSYPLYYNILGSSDNKVHFTDCTNIQIEYNFMDQNGNECPSNKMLIDKLKSNECGFRINEDFKENVTSSFMYFDENISSMTHICGDEGHPHNSRSPNKQNVLCYGKSIWDILLQSPDFREGKMKTEYQDAEFVFFKNIKPRVVVAWENTQRMKKKGEIILNAISKLMIDLPDGSKFSAFPFTDVQGKDYPLVDLNDVNSRKSYISSITSTFDRPAEGNRTKAIEKAFKILQTAAETKDVPPGNIIIITGTSDELIVISLKDFNVCLPTLSDIRKFISENKDELTSELPCLEVVKFLMDDPPEDIFEKLTETIGKFCPSKMEDKFTEMLKTEYLENNTAISVEVDEWTEIVTFWIFRPLDSENFLLNDKEDVSTVDETYGKFSKLSYTSTEAGTLEFRYKYSIDTSLVAVEKTSHAGKYIIGEVIVLDTTKEKDDFQMPVIIYAMIRFGSYPVQNANVSATIKHPGGQETYLVLNDDGRGDPDITKNDGVYSRYFTNFTDVGEYTVTVLAFSKGDTTRYGANENAGYRSCCGSFVNGNTPKLSQFSKVFEGKFTAKSARPEGGYKPSRITDLKVGKVEEDGITLTWTAPGAEADSGKVESYEIKSFTLEDDAKNKFESGIDIFKDTYEPKESGETEELKIRYDAFEKDGIYYIAVKAVNSNQTSDISTIVEVKIYNRETTDAPDNGGDEEVKTGKTNPKIIGLIIGVIVGLIVLMIIIYVVIYCVIVKPKRKKERKQKEEEKRKKERKENPVYETSRRTENNAMHPISFVSADTLIKHHNEKVKAKNENKESPIFKEEDFEDRNFKPANESDTSSNDKDREHGDKSPRNGPPLPPKSPKRITRV